MAKPTNEVLNLPNFDVPMVRQIGAEFLEESINLSQFIGQSQKGLILYFYPKDNTSGCTTQATDFTQMISDFDKLGYDIIGVSRDSIESHKKFIEKHDLKIALISDEDERLCQYFEVIKEKTMYGKKVLGLLRSTFVFDKNGNLTHAQRNLRAKGYTDRLLSLLPPA